MPDFGRVIALAYMRILGRPPDPGGQQSYDRLMNQGMTEAMMREALLRSPEYAAKNPDQPTVQATKGVARRRSKASRKKTRANRPTKKKSRRKTR